MEGDIEEVDRGLLITRVRIRYKLKVPREKRAEAQRALEAHERRCPVSQSVQRGIRVEWEGEITEEG